jgi:hypothetical protein
VRGEQHGRQAAARAPSTFAHHQGGCTLTLDFVLSQVVDEADRGGANPHLKDKVKVVKGKIEDYNGPQVDTLVSEPIGERPTSW